MLVQKLLKPNITTPQNRNRYDSDSKSLGMQAGIPLAGFGLAGGSSPDIPESQDTITGGVKDIHNNYLSTEKHVSGIEAGSGGLDINVGGTTTINGGAITSTADASKNVINTDRLVGNSLDNHSIWSGLNVNGTETLKSQYTVAGVATDEKENNLLPGNVLNKVVGPGFTGNITTHNEHSKTEAAIGDNITINAGSITGTISRDPDAANGYLADRFDANKIDSNFKKQNEITQTINTISDAIINTVYNDKKPNRDNHAQSGNALKPNGGEGTNVTATPSGEISDRDIMKMGASGIASITGAALGGGDVGATVAGVAAADAVNTELPNIGQVIADKIAPPVENPLKPNNNGVSTKERGNVSGIGSKLQSNKVQQSNSNQKNPTYDETNDLNKLIAGMTQNVIVGGSGALAGIATSGDNMSLDATAGGLTALKQNAPNISNPDLKHVRKPRDQDGRSRNPLKPMTSSQGQKASSQKGNQNDKI